MSICDAQNDEQEDEGEEGGTEDEDEDEDEIDHGGSERYWHRAETSAHHGLKASVKKCQ